MKSITEIIKERNIHLDTLDPVARGGFTQVPNFILKNPTLSLGAKVAYAMFLSYAWHNDSCFPGQDRLAADMGITRPRVTQLIAELQTRRPRRRPASGTGKDQPLYDPLPGQGARNSVCTSWGKPVYLKK